MKTQKEIEKKIIAESKYMKGHSSPKDLRKAIRLSFNQGSQSKEKEMLDKFEKMIDEMKYCIKTGVHICNKHPEDCDNVINVDEIKERLQKLKGAEK